jgi:steroid 5-alpha reductase family enzyme
MNYSLYLEGLAVMLILAGLTWLLSVIKRDVSIVDSVWSLMILAGAIVYAAGADAYHSRTALILSLLLIWALRLSIHLSWRNWGEPEDRRYRRIRERNSPHFALKSLVIIFVLQALIAWIISLPLWPALTLSSALSLIDMIAVALWLTGMAFESIADWQLARFKADPANQGKVMQHGLWRYSRHPNYFGEALIWWGFYLFAVAVGAWWTLPAPLLMTWLLLKFSGVVMLEEDITERRPAYREYIATTHAFIPGPRKSSSSLSLANGE